MHPLPVSLFKEDSGDFPSSPVDLGLCLPVQGVAGSIPGGGIIPHILLGQKNTELKTEASEGERQCSKKPGRHPADPSGRCGQAARGPTPDPRPAPWGCVCVSPR